MQLFRSNRWLFASALALIGLSACSKSDGGASNGGEAKPTATAAAAAADQALVGHEFLRLTDASPGLLEDLYTDGRLELALDELENYYLGVGVRVLVVERGAAKSYARVIELPRRFTLLGIHDNQMIFVGDHPERCGGGERPRGKLYADPDQRCTSVYTMAFEDQAAPRLVAALDAVDPVLVGDYVAGLVDDALVHVSLTAAGESKRSPTPGSPAGGQLSVEGDRLLWSAIGEADHTIVLRSSAPFDKVEVALDLDLAMDQAAVTDVAWIGENFVYLLGKPSGRDVTIELHRKTSDKDELLLSDLPAGVSLANDGHSAWVIGPKLLWRVDAKEHRKITTSTTPTLVTGTRSGLAWVEAQDDVRSLHLATMGPPGLVAPALPGKILELPVRPQAEADQDKTPDGFVAPW